MGGANKNPSAFGLLLLFGCGALTFYMMLNYVGPFQWLAELQLRWFGAYDEKITFLLTFLLNCAVLGLIVYPIRKLKPQLMSQGMSNIAGLPSLTMQLVGLGFVVSGVMDYTKVSKIGAQVSTTAAQLESGARPASDWVKAEGYPLKDAGAVFDSGYSKERFIPITSLPDGPSGDRVLLFVKCKDGDSIPGDQGNAGIYEGMLAKADLPGPVRVSYEKLKAISDDYYVLELGATPDSRRKQGLTKIYIGAGVAGLAIVVGLAGRFRRRPLVSSGA